MIPQKIESLFYFLFKGILQQLHTTNMDNNENCVVPDVYFEGDCEDCGRTKQVMYNEVTEAILCDGCHGERFVNDFDSPNIYPYKKCSVCAEQKSCGKYNEDCVWFCEDCYSENCVVVNCDN